MVSPRLAAVQRNTRETQISLHLDLESTTNTSLRSPLPYLDHMLHTLACHGQMGLVLEAAGDVHVDPHHLIEDCGIALGHALHEALRGPAGAFTGIQRAGCFSFPMDGTLAEVALDLCGRPNLVWNVPLDGRLLGTLDPYLFREFFKGFVDGALATLHVNVRYHDNDHHVIESIFKAFARSLRSAITRLVDPAAVMSTKGSLAPESGGSG